MDPQPEHLQSDTDLPPSLLRALGETAEYALRLRTGEVVRFTRAERHGSFVTLYAPSGPPGDPRSEESMAAFPQGLEVRISDIVWCARGPTHAADVQDVPQGAPVGVRVPLRIEQSGHNQPER